MFICRYCVVFICRYCVVFMCRYCVVGYWFVCRYCVVCKVLSGTVLRVWMHY